jgi:hypothetical protein
MNFQEGQILLASKRDRDQGYHLVVFLKQSQIVPSHFIGLMLSSKSVHGNIKMSENHFEGGFKYNNTHVGNRRLLKPEEWGPFRPIGNLTSEGLDFVNTHIPFDDNPPLWENL